MNQRNISTSSQPSIFLMKLLLKIKGTHCLSVVICRNDYDDQSSNP